MKKFYLLIFCIGCFFTGNAQTAIDPSGIGGFDAGNDFASNGWIVVNSSGNKWIVGDGASSTPPSAPNTAFISADGSNNNYSYDNQHTHISHFYKQITIPPEAFNISLSFFLKGNVESDTNLNVIDGLTVFTDNTPPVADAMPGNTAVPRFPQFNSQLDYTQQILSLPDLAGQTVYLIFTWANDGNGVGDGPPASVDGIALSYCIKAADYGLTGGGSFCTGSSGVGVGLAGSTEGITYQLYHDGNPVGDPVEGTGSPIDFGPQNLSGNYTVIGTSQCGYTYSMPGLVSVSETPLPTPTAGSNSPLCLGSALNLTSSGGSSYSWTGPNGFASTDQNPSIPDFTADDAGTYTVAVTNNSCSAVATTEVALSAEGVTAGTIAPVSVCSGDNGSLTLSGNSNDPQYWESSTDSTSATWTRITNTSATQSFSGVTVPTFYRALVSNGCGTAYSSIGTVQIHNYWTGGDATNPTDWNTAANWSDNTVPSTSCNDVYIPMTPNKPILNSAPVATITNLHIFTGASVTVNGTGKMQIGGTISNDGTFDLTDGTLELNGTGATQNIEGNLFKSNTIKNLVVSNNVTVANASNDTLNILGKLSFGKATAELKTGDNLTLKSSATATANVGKLSTGDVITGKVTVERYINTGTGGHGKSWQLLATPTTGGQSIKASWQEGATATNISVAGAPYSAGNLHPGYGTMITSPVANAVNQPSPGFDAHTSVGASMKTYISASDSYDAGPSSTANALYNQKGYLVLVRGDRSVYTSSGLATPTILRSTGTLFTPGMPPPPTTVPADKFESVGNPYASAIDMHNINLGGKVNNVFTVWDPKLTGIYGLGAYQYLSKTGDPSDPNYYALPGGGSYGSGPVNSIQSGQAFLVQTTGGPGTVSFDENCKTDGSTTVLRAQDATAKNVQLRAILYGINKDSSTYITDGNLVQYSAAYSNKIDILDARKIINGAENFGIVSGGKLLAIERRTDIIAGDTIFYRVSGLAKQNYRVQFTASGLSSYGLQGYIEDHFLRTRTALNPQGITDLNFTVNADPGSYSADRFMIVFNKKSIAIPFPVVFISVDAAQKDDGVLVKWKVRDEKNISQYEVQKSFDGVHFTAVAIQQPHNEEIAESYDVTDTDPGEGYNFYRIKCIGKNGAITYSTMVKVKVSQAMQKIAIYPNRITDGIIHLRLINQPGGKYGIRLLDNLGRLIVKKQISHAGGSSTELIQWNYNLAHGIYQLEVMRPDGSLRVLKIMY